MSATIARSSFDGLNTGTGRAETSTGAPVRGFRAILVLRWRILNVPKPRTSMFFCSCRASLIASRKESTTRAQSFLEIIGPAVCEICAVTRSTKSAFVIEGPRKGRVRNRRQRLETRPLTVVCQALGSLEAGSETTADGAGRRGRARREIGVGTLNRALPNRVHELEEEWPRVVRPWRRLGVILHGKDRLLAVLQPFHGAVVQIHVRYLERWGARYPFLVALHGEPMVLRRDQDASGGKLLDRMIPTAVAVRHLHGRAAECQAQQLMAEANPKHRYAGGRDFPDRARCVLDRGGVPWAVAQEDTIGAALQNLRRRGGGRDDRDSTPLLLEKAQDIALDAEVVGDDVRLRTRVAPGILRLRGDPRREIEPLHARTRL